MNVYKCMYENMELIYVINIRVYIAKVYMYAMCQLYKQHQIQPLS